MSEARLVAAFADTAMADAYPDVATLESCALASTRDTIALIERAAVQQLGIIFAVV